MRCLLINSNRFHQPWPVIPTGVCAVAAAMEDAGYEVRVLDLTFASDPGERIRSTLASWMPDAVGVSVRNIDNCAGYDTDFLLADTKKTVFEPLHAAYDGPLIVGGPAVGVGGAELVRYLGAEYGIRGDGEAASVAWLDCLRDGTEPSEVGGLIWIRDGEMLCDNAPLRVENMGELRQAQPHRYVDLAPYGRFDSPLQIQTKRGCALKCSYCTYNAIEGNRYRRRDPQQIADDIEALYLETGVDFFEFTDSTFNLPLRHAKDVLSAIARKRLPLRFRTMGLNPSAVDEELADLMVEVGFRDVDLGIETASAATLRGLGKNFDVQDIRKAGRILRQRQIPVTWYLLMGGPGETAQTITETFAVLDEIVAPWDLINVGIGLRVYAETPIARKMVATGMLPADETFLWPVAFRPRGLSLNELKARVKLQALRRLNVFCYDEDENTPSWLLRLAATLFRVFSPRQPMWRLFPVLRALQRFSGADLVRLNRTRRWLRREISAAGNGEAALELSAASTPTPG